MPNKLRILSGDQMVKFFSALGFELRSIRGSHMKLIRETPQGDQMLLIPRHKTPRKGTIKGIYNQAKRFIPEKDLKPFFYTE